MVKKEATIMNRIIEHQNDRHILEMLSAQRNLYRKAKQWRNVRFFVCVFSVLVISMMKAIWNDSNGMAIILSLTVFLTLLSGPVFNKQVDKRRELASRIRQLLDIELFGQTWDEDYYGKKPTPEEVFDNKSKMISNDLLDWYDKGIGEVQDLNTAILLCQRENLCYDSHIRSSFTKFCVLIAVLVCFCIISVGAIINRGDMLSIITFGLIPITPVVRWIQSVKNEDSKDRGTRDILESLVAKEMEIVMKGKAVHVTELKRIQNLMFSHRRDGYLVPEWYYKINRKKSETRAAYSIRDFLDKSTLVK